MTNIKSIKFTTLQSSSLKNNSKNLFTNNDKTNSIEEINLFSPAFRISINSTYYTIDESGNISLKQTAPQLEIKIQELIKKCKENGINIKISYTTRSEQEQNDLYAICRTKDKNGNNLSKNEIKKIKIIKEMLGKKKCAQETYEILNIDKKRL